MRRKLSGPAPVFRALWLLGSMAVFGVVAGLVGYGGVLSQQSLDAALGREVIARNAIRELNTGMMNLHADLQGGHAITASEASAEVAALDAALARYLALPLSAEERELAGEAASAYRNWRDRYAGPSILALFDEEQVAAPAAGGLVTDIRAVRLSTAANQAFARLDRESRDERNARLVAAFTAFKREGFVLMSTGALGILAALIAGWAAVGRIERILDAEEEDATPPPPAPPVFDDGGYAGYPLRGGGTPAGQPL